MRTEIQDFIDQEAPSGLQLSPDGRFGAFVVTKPDGEENCYHSWLQVVDVENGTVRKLTVEKRRRALPGRTGSSFSLWETGKKTGREKLCFTGFPLPEARPSFAGPFPRAPERSGGQNGILYCLVHEHYYEKEEDYEVFDEIPFLE